ncbi:MAG: hypothetical protein ACRDIU_03055 [Actinomycetota bacterium]
MKPAGKQKYRLADAQLHEMEFGFVWIEVESEKVPGLVVFGQETESPLLGVTALEAAGLAVDPVNRKLTKLPSKPLL